MSSAMSPFTCPWWSIGARVPRQRRFAGHLCLLVALAMPVGSAQAALFIVNSTADDPDDDIGDGVCANGTGRCTLRAAIQEANDTTAWDFIGFDIDTRPTTGIP